MGECYFWYWFTWVVLDKGPLNVCECLAKLLYKGRLPRMHTVHTLTPYDKILEMNFCQSSHPLSFCLILFTSMLNPLRARNFE